MLKEKGKLLGLTLAPYYIFIYEKNIKDAEPEKYSILKEFVLEHEIQHSHQFETHNYNQDIEILEREADEMALNLLKNKYDSNSLEFLYKYC